MKKTILSLLGIAAVATAANAQTLFLTGRADTVRSSTDGGATWGTFATVTGGQLRGIDAGVYGGNTYVFTNNMNGGTGDTDRPLLAYNSSGTLLTSTTYNRSGSFNEQPVGFFGGYVYVSAGGPSNNVSSSWNGTSFGSNPMVTTDLNSWQGNNIAFATNGGINYQYVTGTSGSGFRRATLDGDGTVSNVTAVTTTGGPANLMDLAFTASGRFLTLGSTGIFLSGTNQYTSNSTSLTNAFAFSGTENPATGDMGANARDFAILGNNIYAVTDTRIFRYTLDDTAGTISFVSANTHGFNSTGVQIAAIPEPSSFALLAGGLAALAIFRRRRQS